MVVLVLQIDNAAVNTVIHARLQSHAFTDYIRYVIVRLSSVYNVRAPYSDD